MGKPFEGKVVFITGASSGIGAALAREFARQGAAVALAARREDRLLGLAGEIAAAGGRAEVLRCDVTRDGDLEAAALATVERLGRIDVVVANAGFGVAGNVERLALDDFRRQFETNVFGVLRTFWATIGELKKTRGSIVLIGSVNSYVATPGVSAYGMSKFAVRALAQALHVELARHGVGCTLICPGFVDSDIRKVDNQGRLHEGAKEVMPQWLIMPTATAARQIVSAVRRRRREVVITFHGKVLVLAERAAPAVIAWAMRKFGQGKRKEPRKPEA